MTQTRPARNTEPNPEQDQAHPIIRRSSNHAGAPALLTDALTQNSDRSPDTDASKGARTATVPHEPTGAVTAIGPICELRRRISAC